MSETNEKREPATESPTRLYGSDATVADQRAAFRSGEVSVAVYGLGKMGLPLAAVYAETCGSVIGADIDPEVVEMINNGKCHVKREPRMNGLLEEVVTDGALEATTEPVKAARQAAVHVVIVPTPITDEKEPDLSILDAAVKSIGEGLSRGDIVLIESTVPPGTTTGIVTETLLEASDLDLDAFGVAFCPERTASGQALKDIRGTYPKVVGGINTESTRVAELLYEEINDTGVIPVADATTAEAVKIFEGLYRDVNIALANEVAQLTDIIGIDTREAIEVANTIPFINLHNPGPGVGGHCIPYYPYFIMNSFDTQTPLIKTARTLNDDMPTFTVEKIQECLQRKKVSLDESKIAILGLTYRANVEETRASPARKIAAKLSTAGSEVFLVDPLLDTADDFAGIQIPFPEFQSLDLDAVVLTAAHDEFDAIDWEEFSPMSIIDTRDVLDLDDSSHTVYTIGSGFKRGK